MLLTDASFVNFLSYNVFDDIVMVSVQNYLVLLEGL